MLNSGLMTSATDEWATPQAVFDELNREFGFTLDVCADTWNHKTPRYFSKEQDGLKQDWTGVCWMNPPYGRTIKDWMRKALESSRGGGNRCLPRPGSHGHGMVVGLRHER